VMKRDECLKVLARHRSGEIVVAVYSAAQEWIHISPNELNYTFTGAMGQDSSHGEIKNVIERLAARGDMAILLVEQYFEFARDLADRFYVLNRGETVMEGKRGEMNETNVRRHLTV